MDLNNKKVLFLGDSITEGCGASDLENCYVSLFKKAYPNAKIFNYGIGGTRIAQKLNAPSEIEIWDKHFSSRIQCRISAEFCPAWYRFRSNEHLSG